jgi:hypothetical protein
MRADAGEQHGEAEGFDEIVIGAGVEADDDVDLGAPCGEDDEQDLGVVVAHSAGKLDTIEVGKAEVEQNDSGFGFSDMDEGGTAGATPGRRVAVALETEVEVVPDGGVVFNDQHRGQYCRQRDRVRPAHAREPTRTSVLAVIA